MTLPLTVAPGATATISATFSPTISGVRTGTMTITSNAASSPTIVALSGTGTGVPLLRLSTLGNQIVTSAAAPIRLKSVNWHGAESNTYCPHGLWVRSYTSMLDQIAGLGFNCIRLPFSDDILNIANVPNGIDFVLNPDLTGQSALQILDKIINYGGAIGIRFILDHHRTSAGAGTDGWPAAGFSGSYTQAMWLTTWQAMATRYSTNPAVAGFDVHNEPYQIDWYTWATGVELLANQIHTIAPDWLCVVEGVGAYSGANYWWGGQLAGIASRPIVLTIPNKVVYSPHEYSLSVGTQTWQASTSNSVAGWPNSLAAIWAAAWSMKWLDNTAPLWIGEFGGHFGFTGAGAADGNANAPYEVQWLNTLVKYLNGDTNLDNTSDLTGTQKGMSFSFWTWGPNSGDTGGLLQDDWATVQSGKLALIAPLLV